MEGGRYTVAMHGCGMHGGKPRGRMRPQPAPSPLSAAGAGLAASAAAGCCCCWSVPPSMRLKGAEGADAADGAEGPVGTAAIEADGAVEEDRAGGGRGRATPTAADGGRPGSPARALGRPA